MAESLVTSQLEKKTVTAPHSTEVDPWHAFRQVEVITLELTQQYKHSLGKYSRFFIELENQSILRDALCRLWRRLYPAAPVVSALFADHRMD